MHRRSWNRRSDLAVASRRAHVRYIADISRRLKRRAPRHDTEARDRGILSPSRFAVGEVERVTIRLHVVLARQQDTPIRFPSTRARYRSRNRSAITLASHGHFAHEQSPVPCVRFASCAVRQERLPIRYGRFHSSLIGQRTTTTTPRGSLTPQFAPFAGDAHTPRPRSLPRTGDRRSARDGSNADDLAARRDGGAGAAVGWKPQVHLHGHGRRSSNRTVSWPLHGYYCLRRLKRRRRRSDRTPCCLASHTANDRVARPDKTVADHGTEFSHHGTEFPSARNSSRRVL